jgi:ferredoxin
MAKLKVTIDREECISCESCWTICPEVFQENPDDHWSEIVEKYRTADNPAEGEVPPELRDKARDAADACPVQIIHIS